MTNTSSDPGTSADPAGFRFVETAAEAWRPSRGPAAVARTLIRSGVIRAASLLPRSSPGSFVRCIYGHPIFPDTTARLRAFVRALKNEGDFIDTGTLIEIIESGEPVQGRYFHLSFDDGLANVFEEGGEVFASENIPYTIFLPTDLVEAEPERLFEYCGYDGPYFGLIRTMTWDQVRACAAAGGEIGCHSRTHCRLSDISGDKARLEDEIAGAKRRIEAETGKACVSFAWPYGTAEDIDHIATNVIQAAGFRINFSALRGRVEPGKTSLMNVPRHNVEFHQPLHELLLWARGFREG